MHLPTVHVLVSQRLWPLMRSFILVIDIGKSCQRAQGDVEFLISHHIKLKKEKA